MRILLTGHDQAFGERAGPALTAQGFAVDRFMGLAEAEEALRILPYDLLLLVLNRPNKGVELIRRQRRAGCTSAVIVVTARNDLAIRVSALDSGADDYLVKPVSLSELIARCRAVLRRPRRLLETVLAAGNLTLESSTRRVRIADAPVAFSVRETNLLELLLRRPEQVVPRSLIERSLYCLQDEITPNAMEAVVSRLRRKLREAGATIGVRTARGVGYALSIRRP